MVRIHFYGPGGTPGPVIDADDAIERGDQILMVADGIQGTIAVRTLQDTVAVVAGPLAGSQWTDAWIEEAGPRSAPAPVYPQALRAGAAASPKAKQSQFEQRLTVAAFLDFVILGANASSDPNGSFLMRPTFWLLLGVVFLAVAAWPWWWSRVTHFVRGRLITGS